MLTLVVRLGDLSVQQLLTLVVRLWDLSVQQLLTLVVRLQQSGRLVTQTLSQTDEGRDKLSRTI